MAEHEEFNFEHGLKARFEQLDAQIKIPEIPDAQGIFDRAEAEKGRVIPFEKYSRYIAVAAAVALICVSLPLVGSALEKFGLSADMMLPQAANEVARDAEFYDLDSDETTAEAAEEEIEAPQENEPQSYYAVSSSEAAAEWSSANSEKNPGENCSLPLEAALRAYFDEGEKEKLDEEVAGEETDAIKTFEENLNKKRSIEITAEEESVSVILKDNAAEGDIIAAFWAEGVYESSGLDEKTGNYVIILKNTVTEEDFESGYYLPMIGDAALGNYAVSADSVEISEKVTEGVIYLKIEVHPGTGEYEISGELK